MVGRPVLILFEDVESVSMMMLHADGPEDGPHGPCCAPLLSDYLADIAGSHAQPQHSALLAFDSFNYNSVRLVDQGAGNFSYQLLHVVRTIYVRHCRASLEDVGMFHSRARVILSATLPRRQKNSSA